MTADLFIAVLVGYVFGVLAVIAIWLMRDPARPPRKPRPEYRITGAYIRARSGGWRWRYKVYRYGPDTYTNGGRREHYVGECSGWRWAASLAARLTVHRDRRRQRRTIKPVEIIFKGRP